MIKKIHQLSKTKELKDFELESQDRLIKLNPVLESQREQILVKCLKEALEISEYKYNNTKTSAIIVGLRHSNPFSAASIVNETIDFFFEYENEYQTRSVKIIGLNL